MSQLKLSNEIWSLIIDQISSQIICCLAWDQDKQVQADQRTLSRLCCSSKWLRDLAFPSLHHNVYLPGFNPAVRFIQASEGRALPTRSLKMVLLDGQPEHDSILILNRLLRFLPEALPNLESLIIQDRSEPHPSSVQSRLEISTDFFLPKERTGITQYCKWYSTLENLELNGVEILFGEDDDLSEDEEDEETDDIDFDDVSSLPARRALKVLDLSDSILDSAFIYSILSSRSLRGLESLTLRNVKDLDEELGILLRKLFIFPEDLTSTSSRPQDRISELKHLDLQGTSLNFFLILSEDKFQEEVARREKTRLGIRTSHDDDEEVEVIENLENVDQNDDYWEYQDSERSDDVDERPEQEEDDARREWFGLEKEDDVDDDKEED